VGSEQRIEMGNDAAWGRSGLPERARTGTRPAAAPGSVVLHDGTGVRPSDRAHVSVRRTSGCEA
jgi:hypothetical protein